MSGPAFDWPADHSDLLPDRQNMLEKAQDRLSRGLITAAEANVMLVHGEGVRIVRGGLPRDVRTALNDAVKRGELAHMKKDGHKPEVYFRPQKRDCALTIRRREESKTLAYRGSVFVHQRDLEAR